MPFYHSRFNEQHLIPHHCPKHERIFNCVDELLKTATRTAAKKFDLPKDKERKKKGVLRT
jgi:hypothetical protein